MTSVGNEKASDETGIHPADEHVVAVDHVAEHGQGSHGINEHPVAEHRPAHVGDEHVGNDAHAGDDCDVDLGMSEEPEQMLPQQSRSAGVRQDLIVDHQVRGDEEAGSGDVIENQQDAGGHQHREMPSGP
jgi:hypothetical protein